MAVDCSDCRAKGMPHAIAKRDGQTLNANQRVGDWYVPGDDNRLVFLAGNPNVNKYHVNDVLVCSSCTGAAAAMGGGVGAPGGGGGMVNPAVQTGGNVGSAVGGAVGDVGRTLGGSVTLAGVTMPLWAWLGGAYVAVTYLGRRR